MLRSRQRAATTSCARGWPRSRPYPPSSSGPPVSTVPPVSSGPQVSPPQVSNVADFFDRPVHGSDWPGGETTAST